MPPLDFPASPITGATYTGPNGVIWVWDGAKWVNGTQIGTAYAPIQSPVFTGNPTAPSPPSGDADTSVATTAFVANAMTTVYTNVGRNLLHNPLFNVAQRGAGAFTANGYALDRWTVGISLDTCSITQAAMIDAQRAQIGDEAATYALTNNFTGNAGAAAYNAVAQGIEGVRRLSGKVVTLSFWAACGSGTPKLGINYYRSFGTGGSPSAVEWLSTTGQSVTLTTTWTRYSVTTTIPSTAGKTLGTNNNDYTMPYLIYSSGATNNVLFGNVGVQSGTVSLWGVQLEVGSVATPLEKPDPRYDLSNCQRFYQAGGWAGAANNAGGAGHGAFSGTTYATAMRATPTLTFYNPLASNASGTSAVQNSPAAFVFQTNALAAGVFYAMAQYTASADL